MIKIKIKKIFPIRRSQICLTIMNRTIRTSITTLMTRARTVRTPRISRTARIRIRIRATTGSRTRAANRVHNFSGAAARQPYLHIFRIHI